jgi:hypothetical protein
MTKGDIGLAIVFFVLGSLVTWFFSWTYYKKSGDELHAEAVKLRQNSTTIIRFLEHMHPNLIANYDENGNAVSLTFTYTPDGGVQTGGAAVVQRSIKATDNK